MGSRVASSAVVALERKPPPSTRKREAEPIWRWFMSWQEKVQSQLAGGSAEQVLADHWPKVQELFRSKVGPAALAAVQDDGQMATVIGLVYDALPFPVRPLVKQDVFVKFCLGHRDKLLPPEK
jgi:hypothetical protein